LTRKQVTVAILVLKALEKNSEKKYKLTLSELEDETNIKRSTLARNLDTLDHIGVVTKNTQGVSVGPKAMKYMTSWLGGLL